MEPVELTCFCQQYKTAIIFFFNCFPTNNSPNYVNSILTTITVRLSKYTKYASMLAAVRCLLKHCIISERMQIHGWRRRGQGSGHVGVTAEDKYGGMLRVQLRWLRLALAQNKLRDTLSPTVPTTSPQWPHKRVSVSPELRSEQWPCSPFSGILTPSTHRSTMLPIGWSGIAKSPTVDANSLRPRHLSAG